MFQKFNDKNVNYSKVRVGWNERTLSLFSKIDRPTIHRAASPAELLEFTTRARSKLIGLVPDEVLHRAHAHNPEIFQVISFVDAIYDPIGFNAAMPLTETGYQALVSGDFDQTDPDLSLVAKRGEPVHAIYVWLIFTPKSFIACAKALSELALNLNPAGCDLFCRGATKRTYDFMVSVGYEEANLTFVDAPKGLLVMHPVRDMTKHHEVKVATSLDDIMQVIAIRAATFMSEQECPFREEFDGNDFCGAHLIGYIDGEPAGCIRVRFFSDFVKFERLAVRAEFRKSKLAFQLVRGAILYAGKKGYRRMYGHARYDLVRFWETFGFRRIPMRPDFCFSDVSYVEMEGPIRADEAGLAIGDNPLVLVRPEGAWHRPGPLERSGDEQRSKRIQKIFRVGAN